MSAGAWLMLGITWPVVLGISGYLMWKVLSNPDAPSDPDR